jgi:hypothetical protein
MSAFADAFHVVLAFVAFMLLLGLVGSHCNRSAAPRDNGVCNGQHE